MTQFIRSLSGHALENIGDGRLTSVTIGRKGINEGGEDWGLYGYWKNSATKAPILTRSMIEGTLCSYSTSDQATLRGILSSDEDTIKLFCLTLMDVFCERLSRPEAVLAIRDVLEDALARTAKGV